jgi:hypothetical protein
MENNNMKKNSFFKSLIFLLTIMVLVVVSILVYNRYVDNMRQRIVDNIYSVSSDVFYFKTKIRHDNYRKIVNGLVKLDSISTDDKLNQIIGSSKHGSTKAYVYTLLCKRNKSKAFDVLLKYLEDTSKVNIIEKRDEYEDILANTMVKITLENCVKNKRDTLYLDSILIYNHTANEIAYYGELFEHLPISRKYSSIVREKYFQGNIYALLWLARMKHPADKKFIMQALNSPKKSVSSGFVHKTSIEVALAAVRFWPNKDFMPMVEKLCRQFRLSGSEIREMFQVMLAYDNDWAVNTLDTFFDMERRKEDNLTCSIAVEVFYGFYKENPRPRFMPLFKKYKRFGEL